MSGPAEASGKLVWITGAGKGIGRAVATRMVRDGWKVAASARTQADLDSLVSDAGDNILPYVLDITSRDASQQTVDKIIEDHGQIDLAILNAGTHVPQTAETFDIDTFEHLIRTNLTGTVYGLSPLMKHMIARKGGHIAVVSSLAGYRGLPTSAAYGASKAALINMCEAFRPELEPHGVKLTLINPGFVKTPLTDLNDFPMPFLITAEEAAETIVKGLAKERFEITFPWKFAAFMRLLRILPDSLFFRITRSMVRK